jgi:hypothetical protein
VEDLDMNATEVVGMARGAGIELAIDGHNLLLSAASEPPPSVIEELRRHKHEIIEPLWCEHDRLEGRQHTPEPGPCDEVLAKPCMKCVDHVARHRWQQMIWDADILLAKWGARAQALGWASQELFGLHTPPERPAANYHRLVRYNETGLIWLLRGRRVIALTTTMAAIQGATAALKYRKLNRPALGLLGDSLDGLRSAQ